MLQSVNSFLTPPVQARKTSRRSNSPPPGDDDIIIVSRKDDDVIVNSPLAGSGGSPYSSLVREFPLKVRCRADLQKIPVLSVRPSVTAAARPPAPQLTAVCLSFSPRP